MASSMGDSTIPCSIPVELVDESELEAIEAALVLATSVSKRLRTSPPDVTWAEGNADSAGRRLPVWANHATRDQARSNPSNHSRDDANSLSITTDKRFAQYNEPYGRRFESQQRPASSLSVSTEAQSSDWSTLLRPPWRAPPKAVVPKINFCGRIVYSRTWSEVEKATSELLQLVESKKSNMTGRVPLGFDLEWRPYFNRGGEIPRKVALLQICADKDRCDVMHIIHSGIPPLLLSLLEDGSTVKVGVGIGGDASRMLTDYSVCVQGIEDLSSIANRKLGECPKQWSLSGLCKKLTCKEVKKIAGGGRSFGSGNSPTAHILQCFNKGVVIAFSAFQFSHLSHFLLAGLTILLHILIISYLWQVARAFLASWELKRTRKHPVAQQLNLGASLRQFHPFHLLSSGQAKKYKIGRLGSEPFIYSTTTICCYGCICFLVPLCGAEIFTRSTC